MVSTRRSGRANTANSGNADIPPSGVGLRAAANQRRQQRQAGSAAARRRGGAAGPSGSATSKAALPGVLQEMLVEAGVRRRPEHAGSPPPAKRLKRPGEKSAVQKPQNVDSESEDDEDDDDGDDDDDDVAFEDIEIPAPVVQTTERASDEEEDDDDDDDDDNDEHGGMPFGELGGNTAHDSHDPSSTTLELNLSEHARALPPAWPGRRRGGVRAAATPRRPPLSRAERARRVVVHKVHVLCLLAHVARRNRWCSARAVHAALRPLLPDRVVAQLHPERRRDGRGHPLTQFGQTESLKAGLTAAAELFRKRFAVTARGLRRALWAASPDQLAASASASALPPEAEAEAVLDRDDFVAAARSLRGSRDVGAQLFCALLRAVGVEARLVCSLQPLPFQAGAPTRAATGLLSRPTSRHHHPKTTADTIPSIYRSPPPSKANDDLTTTTPLRRLGHPLAAAYAIPPAEPPRQPSRRAATPPPPPPPHADAAPPEIRGESPFPVYWVEVLDVAHQKWQPVDALVTATQWRPAKLEPPASDANNQLTYAMAFAADGSAKDVTRRYAKAFNAKTRHARVDGIPGPPSSSFSSPGGTPGDTPGDQWLRRTLRRFRRRGLPSNIDQIEDAELAAVAAREPLPRNVADYLHHPLYALERHLHRHEVLTPGATAVGTVVVGTGTTATAAAGGSASERIYRRRDVRVAYSADRWYRLGRVVEPGALPAKWLPKAKKTTGRGDDDDSDNDGLGNALDADGHPLPNGTPLFTPEQTTLFTPAPVVAGRVPKNRFGNIDVYVPSMVPAGGVHIDAPETARAAALLRVDAAPALTGFRFEGRRGTAVLRGAVVAAEHADAVRAVVDGLRDVVAADEAERRAQAALRAWALFLRGLRIRQRIWAAAQDRGEDVDAETANVDVGHDRARSDSPPANNDPTDSPADSPAADYDDYGGGGFIPE